MLKNLDHWIKPSKQTRYLYPFHGKFTNRRWSSRSEPTPAVACRRCPAAPTEPSSHVNSPDPTDSVKILDWFFQSSCKRPTTPVATLFSLEKSSYWLECLGKGVFRYVMMLQSAAIGRFPCWPLLRGELKKLLCRLFPWKARSLLSLWWHSKYQNLFMLRRYTTQ